MNTKEDIVHLLRIAFALARAEKDTVLAYIIAMAIEEALAV